MRKRKKPILLITILACSLGAIAAMNYKPSPKQEAPPTPEVGQEVPTKSKEELAKDVAAKMKGATAPKGGPAATKGSPVAAGQGGPPVASGPLGLKPTMKPYKPVYNDSATSAQWYSDETPKEIPPKAGSTNK